ncbi:MerR family transcriptional regulator [Methylobacterium sp. J-090]|uniref:MerR family transcriptional regulator n=1 Tax=Methylobacterium sp. J-090 TaxID=2836666 RepID=UPI001FBB6D10|nr:MerR family transcriptional regulator [Methylobacterium sp. J-090]MCJ2083469.1 MerR family transcriptional regulator [Methylobacterium sp. J-090]
MSLAAAEPRDPQEKSATAFRTIKEAADELEVPQHVLRFWETRFAQVRPVKRAGGRRYYRPDDIDLLKGIRCLLHGQGYTIKGAQGILREKGVRFVQSVGRGEVEVAAPSLPLGQEPHEDAPGADAETGGLSPDAHHILGAALQDLYACRAILTDLRRSADADIT